MKHKHYLITVFILLGVLLSACGAATQETTTPNFAVYAINSEPLTNWDPAIEFSNGIHVHNNIYEQLVRYNSETDIVIPLLAESYSVSEDGLTWTFNIREGVKFQNGNDLTAEDVKYSIERTMDIGAGASYIWFGVEEINVIDPFTVEFELAFQMPLDLVASTGYAAFIYSSECVDENNDWIEEAKNCGTGPYALESSVWGDEVILRKFDGYWGGWQEDSFDVAVFKKVSEPATRRQMIETGEATITVELPYSDIDALKQDENVTVHVEPSFQNLLAMLNTEKAPLDDVLVRQALAYAFPYEEVINTVIGGYGRQSYGVVPYGLWGWSDELPQYTTDLDKAQDLLTEAGFPDGGLDLLLTYTAGNEAQKSSAELYKGNLAELNINLEIRSMPWDSQWELARNPDPEARQDVFMMYWWPDLPSPFSFLFSPFHSEDEPFFNLGYYSNPEFDEMINTANELTSSDFEQARQMFIDAQVFLLEDMPSLFIYDRQDVWVTVRDLNGFNFNPVYPTVVFFHDLTTN